MQDKNGREIITGDVVKIEGAFFKNDNGLWFVMHSPGDPNWSGRDYSLNKIGKTGKISTAKGKCGFWPLFICTNDRCKNAEARLHNKDHATIEVVDYVDRTAIADLFAEEAEITRHMAVDYAYHWGEDNDVYRRYVKIIAYYQTIADRIRNSQEVAV